MGSPFIDRSVYGKEGVHWEVDAITGCWNWIRYVDPKGYGQAVGVGAHRLIFERFKGKIPYGMDLDHLCRNSRCVNPDHLEPVPRMVNIQRGKVAKLSCRKVKFIRQVYAAGAKVNKIARLFDIDHRAIGRTIRGEQWRNVDAS